MKQSLLFLPQLYGEWECNVYKMYSEILWSAYYIFNQLLSFLQCFKAFKTHDKVVKTEQKCNSPKSQDAARFELNYPRVWFKHSFSLNQNNPKHWLAFDRWETKISPCDSGTFQLCFGNNFLVFISIWGWYTNSKEKRFNFR